ncbi:MAG: acyl-CoA thioesterase [Candidatus Kapaibacterium sp.]
MKQGGKISHSYSIRVRYADTDKMGIVYNGNYLVYFEIGRTELMRHHGLSYPELENAGYMLPLVESYARYHNPAFYDDILDIRAELVFENKPFLKFDYKIYKSETLVCSGHTLHAFMSTETRKAVRPPQIFTRAVEKIAGA